MHNQAVFCWYTFTKQLSCEKRDFKRHCFILGDVRKRRMNVLLFISQLIIYSSDNRELEQISKTKGLLLNHVKECYPTKNNIALTYFHPKPKGSFYISNPHPQPSFLISATEIFLPTWMSNNLLYRECKRPHSNQGLFQN